MFFFYKKFNKVENILSIKKPEYCNEELFYFINFIAMSVDSFIVPNYFVVYIQKIPTFFIPTIFRQF